MTSASPSYRVLSKILEHLGWSCERITGSHHIFTKEGHGCIPVALHSKNAVSRAAFLGTLRCVEARTREREERNSKDEMRRKDSSRKPSMVASKDRSKSSVSTAADSPPSSCCDEFEDGVDAGAVHRGGDERDRWRLPVVLVEELRHEPALRAELQAEADALRAAQQDRAGAYLEQLLTDTYEKLATSRFEEAERALKQFVYRVGVRVFGFSVKLLRDLQARDPPGLMPAGGGGGGVGHVQSCREDAERSLLDVDEDLFREHPSQLEELEFVLLSVIRARVFRIIDTLRVISSCETNGLWQLLLLMDHMGRQYWSSDPRIAERRGDVITKFASRFSGDLCSKWTGLNAGFFRYDDPIEDETFRDGFSRLSSGTTKASEREVDENDQWLRMESLFLSQAESATEAFVFVARAVEADLLTRNYAVQHFGHTFAYLSDRVVDYLYAAEFRVLRKFEETKTALESLVRVFGVPLDTVTPSCWHAIRLRQGDYNWSEHHEDADLKNTKASRCSSVFFPRTADLIDLDAAEAQLRNLPSSSWSPMHRLFLSAKTGLPSAEAQRIVLKKHQQHQFSTSLKLGAEYVIWAPHHATEEALPISFPKAVNSEEKEEGGDGDVNGKDGSMFYYAKMALLSSTTSDARRRQMVFSLYTALCPAVEAALNRKCEEGTVEDFGGREFFSWERIRLQLEQEWGVDPFAFQREVWEGAPVADGEEALAKWVMERSSKLTGGNSLAADWGEIHGGVQAGITEIYSIEKDVAPGSRTESGRAANSNSMNTNGGDHHGEGAEGQQGSISKSAIISGGPPEHHDHDGSEVDVGAPSSASWIYAGEEREEAGEGTVVVTRPMNRITARVLLQKVEIFTARATFIQWMAPVYEHFDREYSVIPYNIQRSCQVFLAKTSERRGRGKNTETKNVENTRVKQAAPQEHGQGPTVFCRGDSVILCNLKSRPEWNGLRAEVFGPCEEVSGTPQAQRFVCGVPWTPTGTHVTVSFRADCLALVCPSLVRRQQNRAAAEDLGIVFPDATSGESLARGRRGLAEPNTEVTPEVPHDDKLRDIVQYFFERVRAFAALVFDADGNHGIPPEQAAAGFLDPLVGNALAAVTAEVLYGLVDVVFTLFHQWAGTICTHPVVRKMHEVWSGNAHTFDRHLLYSKYWSRPEWRDFHCNVSNELLGWIAQLAAVMAQFRPAFAIETQAGGSRMPTIMGPPGVVGSGGASRSAAAAGVGGESKATSSNLAREEERARQRRPWPRTHIVWNFKGSCKANAQEDNSINEGGGSESRNSLNRHRYESIVAAEVRAPGGYQYRIRRAEQRKHRGLPIDQEDADPLHFKRAYALLRYVYLPALAERVWHLRDRTGPRSSPSAFEHMLALCNNYCFDVATDSQARAVAVQVLPLPIPDHHEEEEVEPLREKDPRNLHPFARYIDKYLAPGIFGSPEDIRAINPTTLSNDDVNLGRVYDNALCGRYSRCRFFWDKLLANDIASLGKAEFASVRAGEGLFTGIVRSVKLGDAPGITPGIERPARLLTCAKGATEAGHYRILRCSFEVLFYSAVVLDDCGSHEQSARDLIDPKRRGRGGGPVVECGPAHQLEIGAVCEVRDLKSKSGRTLNGRYCVVEARRTISLSSPSDGDPRASDQKSTPSPSSALRWRVHIAGQGFKSLKPENLKLVPPIGDKAERVLSAYSLLNPHGVCDAEFLEHGLLVEQGERGRIKERASLRGSVPTAAELLKLEHCIPQHCQYLVAHICAAMSEILPLRDLLANKKKTTRDGRGGEPSAPYLYHHFSGGKLSYHDFFDQETEALAFALVALVLRRDFPDLRTVGGTRSSKNTTHRGANAKSVVPEKTRAKYVSPIQERREELSGLLGDRDAAVSRLQFARAAALLAFRQIPETSRFWDFKTLDQCLQPGGQHYGTTVLSEFAAMSEKWLPVLTPEYVGNLLADLSMLRNARRKLQDVLKVVFGKGSTFLQEVTADDLRKVIRELLPACGGAGRGNSASSAATFSAPTRGSGAATSSQKYATSSSSGKGTSDQEQQDEDPLLGRYRELRMQNPDWTNRELAEKLGVSKEKLKRIARAA